MTFANRHYIPESISQTYPPVVTITDHGLERGQLIRATQFVDDPEDVATGMEQLNYVLFQVQNVTVNTFELYDTEGQPIDATNYTAYVSGGQFTLTGPDLVFENTA